MNNQGEEEKIENSSVNKSSMKTTLMWTLLIFGALITILVMLDNANQKNNNFRDEMSTENTNNEENNLSKEDLLKNDLISTLKSVKTFTPSKYDKEVTLGFFESWGRLIRDAEKSKIDSLKIIGKQLKVSVIKIQKEELPMLRYLYAKDMNEKLWENNIKVKDYGKNSTTLEFVGGFFASNKNKKDFQNEIRDIVYKLRFKQVNYKWIEHDDEYTYYTMNTKGDEELY